MDSALLPGCVAKAFEIIILYHLDFCFYTYSFFYLVVADNILALESNADRLDTSYPIMKNMPSSKGSLTYIWQES